MDELLAYRQGLISGLEGVITELIRIAAARPANTWQLSSQPGTHTPHFTLFHLRELEAHVFSPLLQNILDQDVLLLPVFDDISWMSSHYEAEKPAQAILEEFINLRMQEIQWLQALPRASWNLCARHPWWGVHTLQWWVELQLDYSHRH
jgi:hypothetical protein